MTAAPDILYRQAAALLEQSNTAQAPAPAATGGRAGLCGSCFRIGQPSAANGQPEQALSWLEAAAAQRHPKALFTLLQQREHNGTPTGQLLNEYAWLGKQGHPEAQLILMRYHAQRNDPQSLTGRSLPLPDMLRLRITIWHAIINAKATLKQPSNNTKKRPHSA